MQVVPGDTIRASGWILAPTNNGGSIDIGCDYFLVTYANCDRARLASDIQPYIDWSVAHNVPLWCGEFGCMSAAPGNSRFNLVRDKISVMNNAGIGWAMWSYRSEQPPSFGLTFQDSVVQALADILAFGFEGETWRVADLTLVRDGQDMLLQWSPVPGASSYSIYAGETPEESEILSTIVGTSATGSFRHLSATSLPKRYYLVIAHFN
jgi:hypothetical protein